MPGLRSTSKSLGESPCDGGNVLLSDIIVRYEAPLSRGRGIGQDASLTQAGDDDSGINAGSSRIKSEKDHIDVEG